MKALGFRSDPAAPRYAIVVGNGSSFSLVNADSESRLLYPATVSTSSNKTVWLYREIERVFHEHADIARVVIKTNEYTQSDSKSKRESAYAEAVVLYYCAQNNVPIELKTYASLGTRSGDVRTHAEQRVGRSVKYWDGKMADAVIAGWCGAGGA
jgi:hypothetical protein